MNSIAFIVTEYLGLSETFIYEEITHLRKYRSIILTHEIQNLDVFPHENIIVLEEGAWKLGFGETIRLSKPVDSAKKMMHRRRAQRYYKKLLDEHDIRIMHAEFGPEGVYVLPVKESFNIPLVTSFRGYDLSMEPVRNPSCYDGLFRVGDLFLMRSVSMIDDAVKLGCSREKCRVHHSGLDLTKFTFKERKPVKKNEQVKILFVGRFVEKKNPLGTIEVFSQVKRKYGNVHLMMIGNGPLLNDATRLVDELGLSTSVELLGYQPPARVVEEMLGSHIFFMPFTTASDGDKEGIPNSVKEASATGLPVVSTSHSGVPEAVLDGKTGMLAEEGDEDALAEKISYLIENQDTWSVFGKAGRKLMEKEFDIVKETEKLEGFYSELLSKT